MRFKFAITQFHILFHPIDHLLDFQALTKAFTFQSRFNIEKIYWNLPKSTGRNGHCGIVKHIWLTMIVIVIQTRSTNHVMVVWVWPQGRLSSLSHSRALCHSCDEHMTTNTWLFWSELASGLGVLVAVLAGENFPRHFRGGYLVKKWVKCRKKHLKLNIRFRLVFQI